MKASAFKIFLLVLGVAVVASGQAVQRIDGRTAPIAAADTIEPVKDGHVTTTRDAQGVWHITGGDDVYDVYRAMGYAAASDRLFQMELYKRQARGTLSEVLGETYLSTDVFLRTIGYSDDELTAEFEALSEDGQAATQGYVDGVNQRIMEIYANFYIMPYEYWIASFNYVFVDGLSQSFLPELWTVNDALAWTAMFFRGFDPEALNMAQLDNLVLFQTWAAVYPTDYLFMFQDMRWINDPTAQTMIPAPASVKAEFRSQLPAVKAGDYPDLSTAAAEIRGTVETYQQQMEDIGARVRMGSYAWAVSGDRTATGNPMLYSGPQMGFEMPSIASEGSIRGGGLEVSGMHVPGLPGIAVGRTPHHAWSAQVGHAHTTDWYLDAPQSAVFHRFETINVYNSDPVTIPVFRTWHGPVVNPLPFNPADPPDYVVSWAYANWGHEADAVDALLAGARAQSIEEFRVAVDTIGVSQHSTYIDRDGNIAYFMTGFDPIRAPGVDPRFPPIGDGTQEWTGAFRERAFDTNTEQGFYGGWNNKAEVDYPNAPNHYGYYFGPAHRAHVIQEYLEANDNVTFEDVRDLALNIATTDSFGGGGNLWTFVGPAFSAAVAANSTPDRDAAIAMLEAWDGHFVAGGPAAWRFGPNKADAWVLLDAWIDEVLRLTFEDEFMMSGFDYGDQPSSINFNVLLRALAGHTLFNWFGDVSGSGKPTTAEEIIVLALDNALADLGGTGPYGVERGVIWFGLPLLAELLDPAFAQIHSIPYSRRSTYAQCVEMGENGPVRIESMFPVGANGNLWFTGYLQPEFDPLYFALAPNYDPFMPRPFPLFD